MYLLKLKYLTESYKLVLYVCSLKRILNMKKLLFLFVIFYSSVTLCQNKGKKYSIRTIAFYNLENLFDTINDVTKNDEASPMMELKENRSKVYWDKIDKLGSVIAQIGKDKSNTSPTILGVCEVENRAVLEDLVNSDRLKSKRYGIIHYESPDRRGIDVALLYQQRYFKPVHHESFNPNIYRDNRKVYTRDQLLVSGYLDDELIHVIVNHWPSRSGGEMKSRPLREKAAYQNTKIIDQIKEKEKNPKILVLGDFNDDPINTSFKKVLKTKEKKKDVEDGDLYNPFERLFKKASENNFITVAHAGEEGPPEYIWEALNLLNVKRIDHGVQCLKDEKLVEKLSKSQIPLTVCPLSNIKLKVFNKLNDHNLKKMLDKKLMVMVKVISLIEKRNDNN